MTAPVPATPSKSKALVGLVGSLLSAVVPWLLDFANLLPPPWPAIIGGVMAVLTALGIYQAPYKPKGTVLVTVNPDVDPPAVSGKPYPNDSWK